MSVLKQIAAATCALMVASAAMAVPARRGLRTLTQPDGTELQLRLVGDENFHTYMTPDGIPVKRDADGVFRYSTTLGLSPMAVSPADSRSDAERAFIRANAAGLDFDLLQEQATATRMTPAKVRAQSPIMRLSQVPQNGSPRVPIILVQYSDIKFKDGNNAKTTFEKFFNQGSSSCYQYFYDQSNGKYTPQFEVFGPYTLPNKRSYYGANVGNYDAHLGEMVAEGCILSDADVNYSNYDNIGDGYCDVVIVLFAGVGEADSDVDDSVWPCQWDLASSDYGQDVTLDGKVVSKFAVFNELYGTGTKIDGIGAFCHEYSHCLNLPDFYATNYKYFGMATWSIMDYGCYNNDGYTPLGYSAYEKNFMGWIDIPEAVENTHYSLPVFNQKNIETDQAVKVTNSEDPDEYYILENRAKQGWDKYMEAEGMLIYHVTYRQKSWEYNTVNNYALQRMTPIPADGTLKMDGSYFDWDDLAGDLWPYGSATELTDTSKPAATVNTGDFMGKPITQIKRESDGNISFWFMKKELPAMETPSAVTVSEVTGTGFTATWSHNPSTPCTYTLQVAEHADCEVAIDTDFEALKSLGGWTTDSTGFAIYDDDVCGARIGSQKKTGAIISPIFVSTSNGCVSIRLNAKSYNLDVDVAPVVSLLTATGSEIESQELNITDTAEDYVVVFDAEPGSQLKVRIATQVANKRMVVYNATIYTGDYRAASPAQAPSVEGDSKKMTISGIAGLSYQVTGLTPATKYDVLVKAVPADGTEYAESVWSAATSVTLGQSGVATVGESVGAQAVYFDLQGRKVANPAPGIYIKREGSKVSKVVVR